MHSRHLATVIEIRTRDFCGIACVNWCVAVVKLYKAMAWLSCVRSRERPEFKAYQRRTLARAYSANYMSTGVVNE